jgi:3',5'-cyclic-AMP phosphodiesterase
MPEPSGNSAGSNGSKGNGLLLLQFTDTHFFGPAEGRLMGVDTAATFGQVVKLAHEKHGAPDFYLLTGDLSQDETEQSYLRFAEIVKDFKAPAYYLPGNHDVRPIMQRAFAANGAPFHNENSFVSGDWVVILLDTQVEGEVHGHLAEAELAHLEKTLSEHPDKHALVSLHHHPVAIGSAWMDQIKVDNSDEFLAILDRHSNVRVVLCGHIHQDFEHQRRGVHFFGTPSTCVQFKPRSEQFALDAVAPGYRWMRLTPSGTFETGVVRVHALAAGLDMASHGY